MRTPRVLATCDDPAVIGAPFYVMERVEGAVLTAAVPSHVAGEHAVDWRA